MKSVRLDQRTAARLKEAARRAGVSESDIIREAIVERTDAILGDTVEPSLSSIIGAIHSRGGRAAHAHAEFGRLLKSGKPARSGLRRSRP